VPLQLDVLAAGQVARTVASIATVQQPCGALPWPDGHTDPWDHVESAMALVVGGRLPEARAAYAWLRATQDDDGSWATSWDATAVLDRSVDSNQCAYVAVGVWQWWLVTGRRRLVDEMWPVVRRALDFVVGLQLAGGQISWSRGPAGEVSGDALLTGSASTYQALRCGVALAELVGEPAPQWEVAAGLLQHAVAHHPEVFLDKSRFSMDWYYPVLGGAVRGPAGREHLRSRWDEFVVPRTGVRCVADRPWVTGAETAELILALVTLGELPTARRLLADVQHLRHDDGAYWTGLVFDEGVRWPVERSAWTAAAIVLANDALAGGPTRSLFTGDDLPTGLVLPVDACLEAGAACTGPSPGVSPVAPPPPARRCPSAPSSRRARTART